MVQLRIPGLSHEPNHTQLSHITERDGDEMNVEEGMAAYVVACSGFDISRGTGNQRGEETMLADAPG